MVLPEEIQIAARECNITAVRAWLESGADPNDTDSRGRTPLIILVDGGMVSEDHLDVARLLLSHGADVNCAAVDGFNPLHCCTVFPEDSPRGSLIQLFLDAGVNVNAMTRDEETPLGMTLACSIWSGPDAARSCLDVVTRLLRAGATLDAIHRDNDSIHESAEDMLRDDEASFRRLPPDFYACKALISDYRAAGSSWKSYVRAPPKELLRLRSLIARGRAREKVRTRSRTPPEIAFLFAPKFPNELFWKVATYWNPRS